VYVLDGKWYDKNISSFDGTKDIITSSRIGLFKTHWINAQKWGSQANKRNWLWKFLDTTIEEDCWYLIIDGDEEIITQDGTTIELKPTLEQVKEDFILLESGPHNENIDYPLEYFQARLIRGHKDIHWYTGDAMVVHDKNCEKMMDYGRGYLYKPYNWLKNMMILNKWILRHKTKTLLIQRERRDKREKGGKCEFKPSKKMV